MTRAKKRKNCFLAVAPFGQPTGHAVTAVHHCRHSGQTAKSMRPLASSAREPVLLVARAAAASSGGGGGFGKATSRRFIESQASLLPTSIKGTPMGAAIFPFFHSLPPYLVGPAALSTFLILSQILSPLEFVHSKLLLHRLRRRVEKEEEEGMLLRSRG